MDEAPKQPYSDEREEKFRMMPVMDTAAQPRSGSRVLCTLARGTKGGGVSPPSIPQLRVGRMKDEA